jgi:hypothetical protein
MIENKPRLVVRESVMQPQTFEISQSVIENMILNATFVMPAVQVVISHKLAVVDAMLRLDADAGHSISGFPRSLVKQETRAMSEFATTGSTFSTNTCPGHRAALLAKRMAAAQSDNSSIYSKTTRSWRPPGSNRGPGSDYAPSERGRTPSITSGTLSPTTTTFSLRSGMSSSIGRYPSGASLPTTNGSAFGDQDRPNLARGLSKASAFSTDSNLSLNDPMPSSTPHGYYSTVTQPIEPFPAPPIPSAPGATPALPASQSSHHPNVSMNAFADQSRYSAGGVPFPKTGSPRITPASPPRKEYSLIPSSPRTNPAYPTPTLRKDPNNFSLPQRNSLRSPTIAEGLYELDGNSHNRGMSARESEIKDLEASDAVNPFMKPETNKDFILKEVKDAKERVRKEEVAPLEERLKALEAMVLQMSQQGNGR